MKLITKTRFFFTTLFWSISIFVLVILTKLDLCEYGSACNVVTSILRPLDLILFVPVFLFPFATLFLFLSSRVFENWKKFAVVAIPIVLFLTYYISNMNDGGGIGVVGFHPGIIYLPLLYGAFFIISLLIIGGTWISEHQKKSI